MHSYAVYKLFADTEELGRLEISRRFVDEDKPLEHQKKIVGEIVQTYVVVDGIEHVIDSEERRIVPYNSKETKNDFQFDFEEDIVKIHARWNGDEIRMNWEGLALIEKPAPQPPVQVAPPQYHQVTHSSRGGWFHKAFGW